MSEGVGVRAPAGDPAVSRVKGVLRRAGVRRVGLPEACAAAALKDARVEIANLRGRLQALGPLVAAIESKALGGAIVHVDVPPADVGAFCRAWPGGGEVALLGPGEA